MKIFSMFLLLAALTTSANAHNIPLAPGEVLVSVNGVAVQQSRPTVATPSSRPVVQGQPAMPAQATSLAQSKANRMAQRGYLGHLGGGFGAGRAEGVGVGSTRDAAIRNCCYWGQRTPVDIGAATNGSRWYACVIYR